MDKPLVDRLGNTLAQDVYACFAENAYCIVKEDKGQWTARFPNGRVLSLGYDETDSSILDPRLLEPASLHKPGEDKFFGAKSFADYQRILAERFKQPPQRSSSPEQSLP